MGDVHGTGLPCIHCRMETDVFMKLVTKDWFERVFSVCGPVCEPCFAKLPVQLGLSKVLYPPRPNEREAYCLEQKERADDEDDDESSSSSDSDSDSYVDYDIEFNRFVEPTEPSQLTSDLWLNWRRMQQARMGLDSKLERHPIRFPHRNSP